MTDERHYEISADVLAREKKITDGTYDEVYDCESFAKWLLAWEILGSEDSGGANMFLVKKNKNTKLCMGPIWDFDQALKGPLDWIGVHKDLFYFHLMQKSTNDSFEKAFYHLWNTKGRKVVEELIDRIDTFASSPLGADYQLSLDIEKDYGIKEGAEQPYFDADQPYFGDLEFMRAYAIEFISKRANWLDYMIPKDTGSSTVNTIAEKTYDTEGYVFDVFGRRVHKKSTGIYILNGEKFYIKP